MYIRYICDDGFHPKGKDTIVCQSDQSYNSTDFKCYPNRCVNPPLLKYGDFKLINRAMANVSFMSLCILRALKSNLQLQTTALL